MTLTRALPCCLALACRPIDVVLLAPTTDASDSSDARAPIPGLVALRVTPVSTSAETEPDAPALVRFTAIGAFEDEERDVTSEVDWSLSDERFGEVREGAFRSSGIGGLVRVQASSGGLDASADLRLMLVAFRYLQGPDDHPEALFAAAEDRAGALSIEYPNDGAVVPPNLAASPIELDGEGPADRFEISFDSSVARVRVYSRTPLLRLDDRLWSSLLETHRELRVSISARSLTVSSPAIATKASPISMSVASEALDGLVYFFSTESQGIQQTQLGSRGSTRVAPASGCAGCHAVSKDGRTLALIGGSRLSVLELDGLRASYQAESGGEEDEGFGSAAFSPDGKRIVYASGGKLRLVDIARSTLVDELEVEGDVGQPDWSPTGEFVVVAYSWEEDSSVGAKSATRARIARIDTRGADHLGMPQVIASPSGSETLAWPSISPDGRFVAYVRAEGESRGTSVAAIELVPASGGAPVRLTALHRAGPSQDSSVDTMPVWASSGRAGVDWLFFSSPRKIGTRAPTGAQLFGSAIDYQKLDAGSDPSAPAFWLPFQSQVSGNYRAELAPRDRARCSRAAELCDGFDDDCDGEIDEGCCTAAAEACNGRDDDCDGAVDERCECAPAEDCENGRDDDCNGDVDRADAVCSD